jgi:Concanavalin A-like lectin/glucanases superfamily
LLRSDPERLATPNDWQPQNRSVLFANNGPGGAVTFSISNRNLFVTLLGIVDQPAKAPIPDDGGWHHVAVVHQNGKELRFYVDGILDDTVAYTGGVLKSYSRLTSTPRWVA